MSLAGFKSSANDTPTHSALGTLLFRSSISTLNCKRPSWRTLLRRACHLSGAGRALTYPSGAVVGGGGCNQTECRARRPYRLPASAPTGLGPARRPLIELRTRPAPRQPGYQGRKRKSGGRGREGRANAKSDVKERKL